MKFLLAFLRTLTNYKNYSESRVSPLTFVLIGRFLSAYIHSRLSKQFSGSQAVPEQLLETQAAYQKARTSSLKRVTGRNFTISK
jgi:hypothetical protein